MSPRKTDIAITMDESLEQIRTRSKARKMDKDVNKDRIKSIEQTPQTQKKKKSFDNKNNLKVDIKQSPKRKSLKRKKEFNESINKTESKNHRLNLSEKVETTDKSITQNNLNLNESEIKIELKDKVNDKNNTSRIKEFDKNNSSLLNKSQSFRQNNKTPNKKLKWKIVLTGVKIPSRMITPKSSPPKLSLTPRRSKKTPKKSPIPSSSPKTHTKAMPRLLKSPRKLTLSTMSGLKNVDKSSGKTRKKTSKKIEKDSYELFSSDMDLSISPLEKNKEKKSSDPKPTMRKFSNPKIISESQKSKKLTSSPKLKLSSSDVKEDSSKISITVPNTTLDMDSLKSLQTSIPSKEKNLLLIKYRGVTLNPKVLRLMTLSQIKDVLTEPIVLLEKLSPNNQVSDRTISKPKSNSLININVDKEKYSLINKDNKLLIPVITKSLEISKLNMLVDRNSDNKLKHSRIKSTKNKISIPRTTDNTLTIQNRYIPLVSSTPQEKETSVMDADLSFDTSITSVINTPLNTQSSRKSRSSIRLINMMNNSANIANVSKPFPVDESISSASRSYLSNDTIKQKAEENDTTMVKEQENQKDGTYELEQPQTLNLRRMIRKRTSTDASLTPKMNNKKSKIFSENVTLDTNSGYKSTVKWAASRSISHDNSQRINMTSAQKLKQINTPKLNRNLLVSTSKNSNLIKLESIQLNIIQNTLKTFDSVPKKSENKSSVKKKPNFARIHERMFSKSESLVDAKKRLENRHIAFTINKTIPKIEAKKEKNRPLPSDTNDGIHNRFGYKVRKAEATNIMVKKQPTFSRQKHQEETRMTVKGVRMNRRFDLQMKFRNIKA